MFGGWAGEEVCQQTIQLMNLQNRLIRVSDRSQGGRLAGAPGVGLAVAQHLGALHLETLSTAPCKMAKCVPDTWGLRAFLDSEEDVRGGGESLFASGISTLCRHEASPARQLGPPDRSVAPVVAEIDSRRTHREI